MNLAFLDPLYRAVAWIVVTIHSGLEHITKAGWTWGLSIVLLTICMRLVLFPLFMKQIKSQREMQLLQPKIAELKKKYPDDRQRQSQEQMALFKEHGVNPLAGCLPLLIQMPIFFALFGVLHKFVQDKNGGYSPHYGLTQLQVEQIAKSKIFGVPIAATFNSSSKMLGSLNVTASTVKTVTVVMIVLMMATSFLTSRQMLARSKASGQQLDSAQAMTQKIMVYGMPLFFGVIGVNFQMGVLLYWLTTNVWTFGQQYFVIKAMGEDPEAVVRARKAKEAGTAVEGKATAAPAKGVGKGGANLTKQPPTKSGAVGATVPVPSAGSTNGSPARNGTNGGTAAARRPGQARPANRKRKGGRH
ncbi:MAG: YidC/Oxa1 family rane protein insertase [Frankiales bacterium]|nr:YidC/Oxa1 family rane protein insertase [Frankiales bacterium]